MLGVMGWTIFHVWCLIPLSIPRELDLLMEMHIFLLRTYSFPFIFEPWVVRCHVWTLCMIMASSGYHFFCFWLQCSFSRLILLFERGFSIALASHVLLSYTQCKWSTLNNNSSTQATVVNDQQTCVLSSFHRKPNTSRLSRPRHLPITTIWPQDICVYLSSLPSES